MCKTKDFYAFVKLLDRRLPVGAVELPLGQGLGFVV